MTVRDAEREYFYLPAVLPEPDAVFRRLVREVEWTDQMHARRTASMGRAYNYGGARYPSDAPWHPAVRELGHALRELFGFESTNCLLNYYPTGEHSIGWHTDDVTILEPGTGIAIISLGHVRTLQLRSGAEPNFEYLRFALEPGSLFWMSQALQSTHKHGIRREPGAGPRLSLTYRRIVRDSVHVDRPQWGSR